MEAVFADVALVVTVSENSEYGTVIHNKDKFKMRGFSTDYITIQYNIMFQSH